MTEITVYAGSSVGVEYYSRDKRLSRYLGEIGGNQVLVRSDNGEYWIDLGLPFNRNYGIGWLGNKLRNFSMKRLEEMRVVPFSKIAEMSREYGSVDVFVSHAHLDHYGCLVYFKNYWRGRKKEYDGEIVEFKVHVPGALENMMRARMTVGRMSKGVAEGADAYISFVRMPENIVPIDVDHSMDHSYSYLVFENDATILYTGDYRFTKEFTIDSYIDKIRKHTDNVDIVITEFTRVSSMNLLKEDELPRKFAETMTGLIAFPVVVLGSYANTRRVRTFIDSGVIDRYDVVYIVDRLAYVMDKIGLMERIADKVKIVVTRDVIGEFAGLYSKYEDALVNDYELAGEINREVGSGIMFVDKYARGGFETLLSYLDDVSRLVAFLSYSEAYDEEGYIQLQNVQKKLLSEGIAVYQLHASGHAYINEIVTLMRKMKEQLRLKNILVVHTTHPELAKSFLFNIVRTIIPIYGKKYCVADGVLNEC